MEEFSRIPDGSRVCRTDSGDGVAGEIATVIGYDIATEQYNVESDSGFVSYWSRRYVTLSGNTSAKSFRQVWPGEEYFMGPHVVPAYTHGSVTVRTSPDAKGFVAVECVCIVHVDNLYPL